MAQVAQILRRLRSEQGSELIEMAMVTPVLLLILAGIFDFGFLFRGWEVVTNAAREGARVGVLPSYDCNPGSPADIQTRVDAYMSASGFSDPSAYTVTIEAPTIATSAGTFTACAVRVSMSQQLPSLSVFTQFFGSAFTSVPIAGSAVMRTEAQAVAPAP
ncbi:MAG: pilus assembly protein [Acidobacteria bacterium]|nr:pilus assembly protein [Acidobacteriota bacterium]